VHGGEFCEQENCACKSGIFNIEKVKDEKGNTIEPVHKFMPGTIASIDSFDVHITPRSSQYERLVDETLERFPWEEGDKKNIDLHM
jgi:hypothetical protein